MSSTATPETIVPETNDSKIRAALLLWQAGLYQEALELNPEGLGGDGDRTEEPDWE